MYQLLKDSSRVQMCQSNLHLLCIPGSYSTLKMAMQNFKNKSPKVPES